MLRMILARASLQTRLSVACFVIHRGLRVLLPHCDHLLVKNQKHMTSRSYEGISLLSYEAVKRAFRHDLRG